MAVSRWHKGFIDGVLSVLAQIAYADHEVLWREVVSANGGYRRLRAVSERNGNLEMDGFLMYPEDKPRKREAEEAK